MLKNNCALITGGGSGMGRATAIEFFRNNAKVVIVGRSEDTLKETRALCDNDIKYYICDVSNEDEVKKLFAQLEENDCIPNIIVNFAGVINIKNDDGSMDDQTVMNINYFGTSNVCETAIPYIIKYKKNGGSIINTASIAGHDGSSDFLSYAASKGAILAYTKSLAMKYGCNGIRVNSISPGVIQTPMSYIETPDFDQYIPELIDMHPLGRIGRPEDIAKVALFLASPLSEFITGQDIVVDGGYTLRE